jgi:uncharacterized membrane protein YbhN (UPF0104 family)
MAVIILLARFRDDLKLIGVAVGLWAIVSAPTNPTVFRYLVRFTGAGKFDPDMAERLVHIRYRSLVTCWFEIATGWMLMGLSVWATARAAGFSAQMGAFDEVAFCIAAVGLSVVGGFLSFLPGGLGVREAALLTLLTPVYHADGALIVSLVSRLVWIVAELVLASLLYLSVRRTPRAGEPPANGNPVSESR